MPNDPSMNYNDPSMNQMMRSGGGGGSSGGYHDGNYHDMQSNRYEMHNQFTINHRKSYTTTSYDSDKINNLPKINTHHKYAPNLVLFVI